MCVCVEAWIRSGAYKNYDTLTQLHESIIVTWVCSDPSDPRCNQIECLGSVRRSNCLTNRSILKKRNALLTRTHTNMMINFSKVYLPPPPPFFLKKNKK